MFIETFSRKCFAIVTNITNVPVNAKVEFKFSKIVIIK